MILIEDENKNPIALIKKHYDSIIIKSLLPITRETQLTVSPKPVSQVFEYCTPEECYIPYEPEVAELSHPLDVLESSEPYEIREQNSEYYIPEFVDAVEEPTQETEKKKKKNRKNKK